MQTPFYLALTQKLKLWDFNLEEFEGCTDDDISKIMLAQSVKYLPPAYIEFLKLVGKGAKSRKFVWDSSWRCSELINMKKRANFILESDGVPDIFPDNSFVFLEYEQYVYWFFQVDPNVIDPEVYLYAEANLKLTGEKLSEFLLGFADDYQTK